ncbi:CocE/NonD family hydrolase [Nocardioides sp. GY 10127]|uniref:CocE/NonD family hydrolase n=1 Tax=Nocardioides sp. GY 10127 TaxID=2569762 RepID=UPI0010A7C649|nr:CocE/NonD family hydrolase [Nocardioides sp. GY 10127]TIC86603.1 CocE/NonD family hydrolase [Nocardioides sp. GY 10127]
MADQEPDPVSVSASEREVEVVVRDGTTLRATLYLPQQDAGPQPCLLEALPYRKDDLTSSWSSQYRSLRDRHGYAVCRLDLRGTGSSEGTAVDEYPATETDDLVDVLVWLAAQPWCTGRVGMFGTSYSGFNALQTACAVAGTPAEPVLGAVVAVHASDDRWTDDVHWRGGSLRLLDLVDYCHYMTPTVLLPPVPALWGPGWREEWARRWATHTPWLHTWLKHAHHDGYWRHGSVRARAGATDGYERLRVPTMLVTGWADGYSNTGLRTTAELARHGVPHRLLAGPWAHADPATAMPGPRVDLDTEMVAFLDRWLRGPAGLGQGEDVGHADVFVRSSTRPEPDLDTHEGHWLRLPSVPPTRSWRRTLHPADAPPATLPVDPSTGTAAWLDCAGHLPFGLPLDQRPDDARSLVHDLDPPEAPVVGHPRVRLVVSADAPQALVSVKLVDVFPDGTGELVTRGTRDLTLAHDLHGERRALAPGVPVALDLELDAVAHRFAPGQRLRLSIAGSDWPNTAAPSGPVTLTVHEAHLDLPLLEGTHPAPSLAPGALHSSERSAADGQTHDEADEVDPRWDVVDDVLRRTTTARTRYGGGDSSGAAPHGATWSEDYRGEVSVDRRTHAQTARAETTYTLSWPGEDRPGEDGPGKNGPVHVRVTSTLEAHVDAAGVRTKISARAEEDGREVAARTWTWPPEAGPIYGEADAG